MKKEPLDILIAEDDLGHSAAIRRSLEKAYPDASISIVTSIREYQDRTALSVPSIAILDLNLTDGCTIDLLSAPLGEALFPTIMMTSYGSEQVAVNAIKRGALNYVVKSSDTIATIGTTVAGALREWQLLKDKQQIELQLKESQAMIIQQEKMASIGQLAAGIAHEINNPIGFVGSNLATLAKYIDKYNRYIDLIEGEIRACAAGVLSEEVQSLRRALKLDYVMRDISMLLAESNEGIDRIKRIVQDLRTFSRADSLSIGTADLNGCLDSTINIVINEIKYAADLKRDYGILPNVSCNAQQVNQVFMNLLINAAHAIQAKGIGVGEIMVRTWCDPDNVFVSVSDTGCGVAPENYGKIFDAFFTTKEVGKGTGLGLSISSSIIRKHGGEILLASELGVGSTFTVRLPLKPPPET